MRNRIGPILTAFALAAFSGIAAPTKAAVPEKTNEIVIRWNLYEGSPLKEIPGPAIVISTKPQVPTAEQLAEAARAPVRNLAAIRNELSSIYQLESIQPLLTDEWTWIRKNEKAIAALLLRGAILPIKFTPQIQPGNRVKVRVQISPAGAAADLVDAEFLAGFNESVVLGFKLSDRSYFLAFEGFLSDSQGRDSGWGSLVSEIDFLQASQPLVQTLPVYPPACKTAGIGGTVILRIDADATGSVARAEVLKGVHPDIDRAAREAVIGWEYEPFLRDGRPVPVSLSVSISFNPDAPAVRSKKSGPAAVEAASPKAKAEDPRLAEILEKTAAYCEKLKQASLHFVCKEHVVELVNSSNPVFWGATNSTRTELLYEYQLVKDKGGVVEKRTLLMENGSRNEENNAPLKTNRFYSYRAVYGPVGFLSREWHDLYAYRIIREETLEGRKAFVVEARPKTVIEGKPNYGKIWVDRDDFSVLRIDVEQESLAGFEVVWRQARRRNYKPAFIVSHAYGIKKGGFRFPSQTIFTERYRKPTITGLNYQGELTLSSTTIHYRDYVFVPDAADVR